MSKKPELRTTKMEGENEQQYTAWLLYTEIGSIRKLLRQWEMLWQGLGKSMAEVERWRERLGKPVSRPTIEKWSKKFQWVKRTDLKLEEDLQALREKTKRIAREKKHKIAELFKGIIDEKLKQIREGEGVTTHDVKEAWEMFQVELGKPTSRTQLIEQSPLTPEEKKEGKELDEKLKQFIRSVEFRSQIGQEREGESPVLGVKKQNKKRKRRKN